MPAPDLSTVSDTLPGGTGPGGAGPAAYAALIFAPLLWAGNFVVGSVSGAFDPVALNALRWGFAALVLCPVVLWHGRAVLRAIRLRWPRILLLAVLGIAGSNVALYSGLPAVGAGMGGILYGTAPLMIAVLSWALFRVRGRRRALGAMVGFLGVACALAGDVQASAAGIPWSGVVAVLAGAALFACFTVAAVSLPVELPSMPFLGLLSIAGCLLMAPFVAVADMVEVATDPGGLGAALYAALGSSVFAYCLWHRGILAVGPGVSCHFLNLVPMFGFGLGAILLGEDIRAEQILGLCLVLTGATLAQNVALPRLRGRRTTRTAPAAPADRGDPPMPRAWRRDYAADRRGETSADMAGPAPRSTRRAGG